MQSIGIGRPQQAHQPHRQDTFDLREQIHAEDHSGNNQYGSTSDEEHSVLEDDSDGEDRDVDYIDEEDDGSSSLSIPNESIDFDLVYSLHSFAATVEGQANVVKGDSLFLMDDSNSYWWLVRVLKTQEVGYIPAENIETPFERLARLNKHRNVDLASATQAELQEDVHASRDRLRNNLSSRAGQNTPSPIPNSGKPRDPHLYSRRSVVFTPSLSVHRYPPAVWGDEEEEEEDVEWDDDPYEDEDADLADEQHQERMMVENAGGPINMEPDDGMGWDDEVAEARQAQVRAIQSQGGIPIALQSGARPGLQQHQQQQQQLAQQQAQAQAQAQQQSLRQQTSRERMQDTVNLTSPGSSGAKGIDPAEITETRKLTVTPSIAQDREAQAAVEASQGPLLPSDIMRKQDEERKRTREEIETLEEAQRKKAKPSQEKDRKVSPTNDKRSVSSQNNGGAKLRKERDTDDESVKEREKDKKKKGGLFSGLFGGGKKDKKEKGLSANSTDGGSIDLGRASSESGLSSNQHAGADAMSSNTSTALQLQQNIPNSIRNSTNPRNIVQQQQDQSPQGSPGQISQHASQLRQRDQQQQALYKQYLNHSPSSPPEASPNYGLQNVSAVLPGSISFNSSANSSLGLGLSPRPRPGSLVLSPTAIDGQGVGVPDLSVIRVFAGPGVQTEATFKTVLLNSSTTSSDLVRQAIQRFRLPAGENENNYYLTIKQVEGSSAVLLAGENPLKVFETLVEAAMELPKVKRSSVGSISSVSSNLSMHPAITKLPMNDFTDDSAVKFYLNRKGEESLDGSPLEDDSDITLMADQTQDSMDTSRSQLLSITSSPINADRFSSPSFRFALQLVIYPDDLPDDMVFDPVTEAIVFKNTLRDRSQTSVSSYGVSQSMRRKVFMFPKNVTVAEVIEIGLERFGILEGVVDGGDEVEDKTQKRRSSVRVRYGLSVDTSGLQERELSPTSRAIDAYPRPPTYRSTERKLGDSKRRSVDSTQLLGNSDDINPDDPTFILRRAVSYRNHNSRHRLSAPLDELALSHLHRESASGSSMNSDSATPEDKPKQLSRQELIAAQRAASRDKQKSILSAQTNSVRGVDVLLPGNAMIRSSRYDSGDKMRYSYVEPDGETYDISDIVEEEWQDDVDANKNDLLEGYLVRNKNSLGDNFDRVLSKIKDGKVTGRVPTTQSSSGSQLDSLGTMRSTSPSEYSIEQDAGRRSATPQSAAGARTPTPTSATLGGASSGTSRAASPATRNITPVGQDSRRTRTNTPSATRPDPQRNPSIASVMSDLSGYVTPSSNLPGESPDGSPRIATPKPVRRRPYLPKDDFGLSHMMSIIQVTGSTPKQPPPQVDPVDELLFGRKLDLNSLHPQARDIYAESFKQLEAMDKALDDFLQRTIRT